MRNILIFIIIIIGIFFRFYRLDSVPPSASLDEVSLGYNAFSILKTGKDEYGTQLPLILRAYDDWRPGFYVYFIIPFIQIFGLSTIAVRFPSGLLSVGTMIVAYLFCKHMVSMIAIKKNEIAYYSYLPVVMLMLISISPWHIYLSRLGHEVNLGIFLTTAAVASFIYAVTKPGKQHILIVFSILAGLSLNSYQSEKIIIPFMFFLLSLIFRKELFRMKYYTIISFLLGFGITLAIFISTLSSDSLIRFKGTSVFENNQLYEKNASLYIQAKKDHDFLSVFRFSHKITTLDIFISNYLLHLYPKWLFFGQIMENHKVPYLGLMYVWEIIFLISGLCFIIKKNKFHILKYILLIWILVSIFPGGLTTQAPHAMRIFTVIPAIQIISAIGMIELFILFSNKLKNRIAFISPIFFIGILIIVAVSSISFYDKYFLLFPKYHSNSFSYAFQNALKSIIQKMDNYNQIIVSNEANCYQSYMFYLYQSKYDPFKYIVSGGTRSGGYLETHKIDKWLFEPIKWTQRPDNHILYIGNLNDFPPGTSVKQIYSNINGEPTIFVVES